MNTLTQALPSRTIQTTVLGLVLIIGAVGMARAATSPSPTPEVTVFERYDTNHDGQVSIKEALALGMLTKAFEVADINHDGNLNSDEFGKAEFVDAHLKVSNFIDDSVLTAKIKTGLLKNSVVKGLQVHVETYKGIVQLSGFVDDSNKQLAIAQIATAGQIAAGVEGVNKVINNLVMKS
ncbi:BON domain-containing protein [Sulfuriferula thiophila]|uniref:BON domain-containing protein n=1 Tax=Sulfuriferula thiophila TaxID=1781211 RepID=UPI000F614334|nr:BON domain-containing protein [Sulfuriferula thiophila]